MSAADGRVARLARGTAELGLALDAPALGDLLAYLDLLAKWNRVYNLTALRDPEQMLTHHLLDSLAVVAPLRRHTGGAAVRLLDVGSGGGLPGAVIAICCPEIEVTCVDAVAKKASFIQQVSATLGRGNLQGRHARVESIEQCFDVIVSRAFASLGDFVRLSRHARAEGGIWLAMKGKVPSDEIAALPAWVQVFHVEHLIVPGLDAERCLVWLRPNGST
ncbi:MAG TPA: 16S rRNA (guanine(527)-N(7))-methyltransferase RsmG [Ottowia sp.]|uniref:16S rRNA (guanine(527)-N(7))-methyltransferase RsmG n=1 Tax=Ottowia sp. TaxID=1898956 RepID=UPI002BE689F0|nr:16S rRNA (guanine(527)-N(7))-methyltransferase RsmG [Ottowia sp.]HMN22486.1 16S rRNA (guanine(527)-N(7))-methyltransferase RsmG [Ottowia sp.]